MIVSPWSILDFAMSVTGSGSNGGVAMLVAYFDESGTHGEEARVTTVAGLIGSSIEWSRLELPWKKALGNISHFHATDCANQDGLFKSFSRDESEKLSLSLAQLIAERKLFAVSGAVYRDDWNYAASASVKGQYSSRYHFCLAMVLLSVSQISKEHFGNEPVALVFARQDQYKDRSAVFHDVLYESEKNIGSLSFSSPEQLIQLQAADLYSYENYRELLTQLDMPGLKHPRRIQLQTIYKGILVDAKFGGIELLHPVSETTDDFSDFLAEE